MGKLVLITGGNCGLGFETTKNLLSLGYDVLMANRSEKNSKAAVKKLESMKFKGRVSYLLVDLEDRESIRNFVREFNDLDVEIDVLINNAGVLLSKLHLSKNLLEMQFDINYLSHFYLDYLLYPCLKEDALVVSLGSLAHRLDIADIHFDNLNLEGRPYNKMEAYSQSKLALTLYGMELSRCFRGTNKRSVIVHPGVCNTNIVGRYYFKPLYNLARPLVSLFGIKGPKEGVKSIIYSIVENVPNGSYIGPQGKKEHSGDPGFSKLSPKAMDPVIAKKLWRTGEELLDIDFRKLLW